MAILWCGGEDVDFQAAVTVGTTASNFRAGYARCVVACPTSGGSINSQTFPGGAVTSAWLSARVYGNTYSGASNRIIGFGLSGGSKGLYIGTGAAGSTNKVTITTYDGTTNTILATESGASWTSNGIHRVEMQVVNYGASATVNVYIDGVLVVTFSGDVTVSGMSNFNCVSLGLVSSTNPGCTISEIIVADEDPRAFPGLVTLALTGAGTTDQWSGVYSTINQTTLSDANPNFTDTNAQDQQFNWTDLPSGTFDIKAVKISARMAKSASPSVTQVKLGYNSGGSTGFGTGATKALTTAYATYQQLDAQNPVTSAAWAQSEMNALQVDLQSVT